MIASVVLSDGAIRRLGGKAEIRVETRVLAATNKDLSRALADGSLREDLAPGAHHLGPSAGRTSAAEMNNIGRRAEAKVSAQPIGERHE